LTIMRDSRFPPPVIAMARVIAHASTSEPVVWTGRQRVHVGDQLLGPVPRLAICQGISGAPTDFLLLYCDEAWTAIAATGASTIERAKQIAETAYGGVTSQWTTVDVSQADADAYVRQTFPELVCSFCGRLATEVPGMIQGARASICHRCVEDMRPAIQGRR
jgi:hypothetical protein